MPRSSIPSSRPAARPGKSGRPGSTARFARSSRRPASRPLAPRFTPRGSKAKGKSAGRTGMLGKLPFGRSKAKPASSGRGKRGAGLAALTAAAGFAVSNRDKIGELLNRRKRQPEPAAPAPAATADDREPSTP
jgi:hypothetical protein